MITNLEEGGKAKCQQYWPDSGTRNFGPFQVFMVDERILADYTIRTLTVQVFEMCCGLELMNFCCVPCSFLATLNILTN